MLKVAYVINYVINNGPSRVVLNLINSLDRSRFVPVLVTLISEKNDAAIIDTIREHTEVIELGFHDHKDCLIRGRSVFGKELKQSGISVVHSHGLIPDMITVLYGKGFRRVSTIHSNLWEDYESEFGRIGKLLWAPLHLRFLRKMDLCVCCSSSVCDALRAWLPKCTFVRNGISPHQEKTIVNEHEKGLIEKAVSDIPDTAFVFLFAGRMIERKNPDWLVREFVSSREEDEYLIMAGEGPLMEACMSAGDDHVRFPGFINNIQQLFEISDAYISASASEGLSIAVIEAMEQGLALFLSVIPSHKEIFEISDDCYLGELFREQDFKMSLERFRRNRSLLDKQSIRNIQIQHLSSAAMAEGYEKIYSKL